MLKDKSQIFYDRGEAMWSELLKQTDPSAKPDAWIGRAEASLWPRLGSRFYFRPEMEFPTITADPPHRVNGDKQRGERADARPRKDGGATSAARPEGTTP
ncbi:MAG: hypothetical protein HYR74_02510 [Candidatus Eisenbacteria bacterium]|nr:hypothetical protein [Candidatus Eisenbacteria bacterium]